jgi:DNA-binding transcriptional MerR regulator
MIDKIDNKKTYYSISEVCKETGLEQHVLRYWETEFFQLKPKKNRAGNRAYRTKDIKVIKYIKHLLYDQHFTIIGAKKRLSEVKEYDVETQMELPIQEPKHVFKTRDMEGIKKELQALLKLLRS